MGNTTLCIQWDPDFCFSLLFVILFFTRFFSEENNVISLHQTEKMKKKKQYCI